MTDDVDYNSDQVSGLTSDTTGSIFSIESRGDQMAGTFDLQTPTPCILFVDDDERTLRLLTRSYEETGWSILMANSGNDGLRLLA